MTDRLKPVSHSPDPGTLESILIASDRRDGTSNDLCYATADLSEPGYTLRIKDLPQSDRPRDRLLEHGPSALSTAELVAILIKTGERTDGLSALGLAQHILHVLQTQNEAGALTQLRNVTAQELMRIPGIGPAKAATIVAAIELGKRAFNHNPKRTAVIDDPALAASTLSQDLMWERQERFAVLFLDIRSRLMSKQIMTVGTTTQTYAHPRDIFGEALRRGAARIIVAHNHPSGTLEPSPDDLSLTQQLIQAGQLVCIPVLDHLILGNGDFISLRQTTALWASLKDTDNTEIHST